MLYSIPEPVDPVGNPPSTQLLIPDVLMMQSELLCNGFARRPLRLARPGQLILWAGSI